MKILLVYPRYPKTYWSFDYALKFISKKANFPPLGLLTVASLIPDEWNVRLVDMNARKLKNSDLEWADLVFISAMIIQKKSAEEVIERCRQLGVKTVAGGPMFTIEPKEFPGVDHLVLDEAEVTLPLFLKDLEKDEARKVYRADRFPDLESTPVPMWDLINIKNYASMNIQYSRGCPFNCDFCNITSLYGRAPRTKSGKAIIAELDSLYHRGWKGSVFFVDDNFIGNRRKLKDEILPSIIAWMKEKKHPFNFFTEASVDLADDEELMTMMAQAGFDQVFVGIESPNDESLNECSKFQNRNRDLAATVKKMHKFGLQVQGGFIVGFDSDPHNIFQKMINFIQESGIVTAMVGLLNAPKGTSLYKRLKDEGRIISGFTGDNTDFTMNFIPKMDKQVLLKGYRKIVDTIYSPKVYYERVTCFLKSFKPFKKGPIIKIDLSRINALFKSIFVLGIFGRERKYYWKLILWTLFRKPKVFPLAITFSIYGYHFRKIYEEACCTGN